MTSDQKPQPAIVVVGASRGIGRAIAELAARDGSPVVLIARSMENLRAVETTIVQAGGTAFALALDLTSDDATTDLEEFLRRYSRQ